MEESVSRALQWEKSPHECVDWLADRSNAVTNAVLKLVQFNSRCISECLPKPCDLGPVNRDSDAFKVWLASRSQTKNEYQPFFDGFDSDSSWPDRLLAGIAANRGLIAAIMKATITVEAVGGAIRFTNIPSGLADELKELAIVLHADMCVLNLLQDNGGVPFNTNKVIELVKCMMHLCRSAASIDGLQRLLCGYEDWARETNRLSNWIECKMVKREAILLTFLDLQSKVPSEHESSKQTVKRLRQLHDTIKAKGQIAPERIASKNNRDERVALKILHLLGLYSGYKKDRKELTPEAEKIIARYDLTAASVTS